MTLEVKNVVGKTLADAKQDLNGFKIEITYTSDTTQEDGIVLEQSVKAGTKLKKGGTITLTVNDIQEEEPEEPTTPEEPEPGTNEVVDEPNDVVDDTNTINEIV